MFKFRFKIICILLTCLLTWNNIVWANPDIVSKPNSAQKDTLQVQNFCHSLTDKPIRRQYILLNSLLAFAGECALRDISFDDIKDVWVDRFIGDMTLSIGTRQVSEVISDAKFLRQIQTGITSAKKINKNTAKIGYEVGGKQFAFEYSNKAPAMKPTKQVVSAIKETISKEPEPVKAEPASQKTSPLKKHNFTKIMEKTYKEVTQLLMQQWVKLTKGGRLYSISTIILTTVFVILPLAASNFSS